MKKFGLITFGTGMIGFLIFGSGIESTKTCAILTAASFVIAAVGYRLWVISEQRSALVESERIRKGKEIEATEKIIARAKENTFNAWLTAGKLDG